MPRTPLYQNSSTVGQVKNGLGFSKFFDQWQADWQVIEPDKTSKGGKQLWLEKFAAMVGNTQQLTETHNRLKQLPNIEAFDFQTSTRFVNGMGYDHPIENGLTWHHTLDVPYLPGSSLKGALRSFAVEWADLIGDEKQHQHHIDQLFGLPTKVGNYIFFDALPIRQVQLEIDVMTPHYAPWYEDQTIPPADWHDPKPIPFLSVAASTTFRFYLQRTTRANEESQHLTTWLQEMLVNIGVGAKTATGYGKWKKA